MTDETAALDGDEAQLARLLDLRERLNLERGRATSPAVASALRQSDVYLFLSLGYLGYTERLLPGDG
jgi:hypothetical protein